MDWKLVLLSKVVKQDQAKAKKKWDEASQHPGSKIERVVVGRIEADEVKSDRECESDGSDDDAPAQESFVRVWLRFGQSLLGQCDGFLVVHIAQEGEKAKDDRK